MADLRERRSGGGSVDSDDFNAVIDAVWDIQSGGFTPAGHLTRIELSTDDLLNAHETYVTIEEGVEGQMIVPLSVFFEHKFGTVPFQDGGNSSLWVFSGGLDDPAQGMWTGGTADALGSTENATSLHYLQSGWVVKSRELVGAPLMFGLQVPVTGGDGSAVLSVAWFYVEAA